jgi:cytochrome c oxidase subunit II
MNRAVMSPQCGQATASSGFERSTYRGLLATATVGFGFYPVACTPRRGTRARHLPPIYFSTVTGRWRGALLMLGLVTSALLLSSCDVPGGLSLIFPTPVSPNGQDIYNLYILISIPAIVIFIATEAAILWVVIRYRRSRQPAEYKPPQIHGNNALEVGWTLAPLAVVLAIAVYSFNELQKDFQPVNNPDMTVVVTGHQFGWTYDYGNGVVVHQEGTLAGDVTPFVVPTNTLIKLVFRGNDVIHSWWVPAVSGKTDAVPGYDNYSWLKISQPGTWRGECAELCGVGHSTMQIIVQAMDKQAYREWVYAQLTALSLPSPSP